MLLWVRLRVLIWQWWWGRGPEGQRSVRVDQRGSLVQQWQPPVSLRKRLFSQRAEDSARCGERASPQASPPPSTRAVVRPSVMRALSLTPTGGVKCLCPHMWPCAAEGSTWLKECCRSLSYWGQKSFWLLGCFDCVCCSVCRSEGSGVIFPVQSR